MAVKFFSEEWCQEVREKINANPAVIKGFKDASTFSHPMYFKLLDATEAKTYFTFEKGVVTEWTTKEIHAEGDIAFGLAGKVEHFREAAEGRTEGGKLLMGGKLKIAHGNIQLAIQNAGAFNNFLLTFGQVDTDWDV
ncbi:MAG: SCP2 sterol-binding domain-containing protein [Sporichthyaceae bacterium]